MSRTRHHNSLRDVRARRRWLMLLPTHFGLDGPPPQPGRGSPCAKSGRRASQAGPRPSSLLRKKAHLRPPAGGRPEQLHSPSYRYLMQSCAGVTPTTARATSTESPPSSGAPTALTSPEEGPRPRDPTNAHGPRLRAPSQPSEGGPLPESALRDLPILGVSPPTISDGARPRRTQIRRCPWWRCPRRSSSTTSTRR